jgi:hypothetical protein
MGSNLELDDEKSKRERSWKFNLNLEKINDDVLFLDHNEETFLRLCFSKLDWKQQSKQKHFPTTSINSNSLSNKRFKIPLKFTKTFNRKFQSKSHVLNNIQMIQKPNKKNLEFIQMSHNLKWVTNIKKISLSKIPLRVQIKLSRIKSFFADKNSLKNEISIFCKFFSRFGGNIKNNDSELPNILSLIIKNLTFPKKNLNKNKQNKNFYSSVAFPLLIKLFFLYF